MRKIKALMFAFVLAGMTVVSCSSDDSSGPAPAIDGKWNVEKTVVKVANGGSSTINYDQNEQGCDKDYIEFAASSVFNEVVYFKAAGSGACQADMAAPGTWTKNDKTLVISANSDLAGTYEIKKLTNSELQVEATKTIGGVSSTATIFFKKAN